MAGPTRAVSATSSPPDDRLTCIVTWRQQRQRLQQNLQQTACRSLNDMSDQELEQRLGGLCNDLMDYLATSHGSIYTRCYRAERVQHPARNERSRLLKDIWLHLGRTTDAALGFNRRCETPQWKHCSTDSMRNSASLTRCCPCALHLRNSCWN